MERTETTRRCNEGVKEARVGDEGGEKKGEDEAGQGGGRGKKKKRKRNNEYIFPLSDFLGVRCVSSLEQRPGNLIPFSIYLNPFTQTPLPTSSTFGLFLLFSACLPSAAVTSPTLIRSSPWRGFLPFEFAERKEAHVSAASCLLYECCIANLREDLE